MFILITIQNLEIRNWAAERWVLGINAWKHVNTLNDLFKAIQKKRNKSNRTGMVKKTFDRMQRPRSEATNKQNDAAMSILSWEKLTQKRSLILFLVLKYVDFLCY